jgi:phosphohistidine phosphatase SixA
MKTLYLLRHAKSSWDDRSLADRDRPLDARGEREAVKMSKRWRQTHQTLDLILSSPAARAMMTAKIVAQGLGDKTRTIAIDDRLYAATKPTLIAIIESLDDTLDRVMLVGHNPGFAELAHHFNSRVIDMPSCALAAFRFEPSSWAGIGQACPSQTRIDAPRKARRSGITTPGTAAINAKPIYLRARVSVEAGFRAIFGNGLAQMQDNAIGVVQDADPESIHQMRVGLRRLRSARRLFARWIAFPPTLQQELAWLADELGAARDADVLANSTLPMAIEICPQAQLLALRAGMSAIACEKRQQAAAAVASVRHAHLMRQLLDWLQTSQWREAITEAARSELAAPLASRATRLLARRHERLITLGRRLPNATTEVRHEVRIAAKKARYATEFFQSLYPARRVKRYISRLQALQDRLGWFNDCAVADRLLCEIETRRPEWARGAALTRGYLCASVKQDLPRLDRLWKAFASTTPPWSRS